MVKALPIALATLLTVYISACDRGNSPVRETVGDTASSKLGAPLSGKAEYDRVCGRCHDEGLDGAPRTGDRAAWAERSDMPAMGGSVDLQGREVKAAAEYMLSITHPELAPDPH